MITRVIFGQHDHVNFNIKLDMSVARNDMVYLRLPSMRHVLVKGQN